MTDVALHTAPLSPVPRTSGLQIVAKYPAEQELISVLLNKDQALKALLDDFKVEVKRCFPRCDKLRVSLDRKVPDKICVEVFVNQDHEQTEDSAQALLSWVSQAIGRLGSRRLAYLLL